MILLNLIAELRNLLDDKGGHSTDWELDASQSLLRWSNDELLVLLNEAEREVCRRTDLLSDNITEEVVDIDVITDEEHYTLSPLITKVRRYRLVSTDKTLEKVSWKDLEDIDPIWDSRTGTPTKIVDDLNTGQFKLYPIPIVDDTIKLIVYRLPLDDLVWANRDWQEPEIPAEYHRKMLHWAAHLAYEKDEPNTLDRNKSDYHRQKFEHEFGPKTDAYSQERKKRVNRGIKYGGL